MFAHYIHFSQQILLTFYIEHGDMTAVLFARFQNDSSTMKDGTSQFEISNEENLQSLNFSTECLQKWSCV